MNNNIKSDYIGEYVRVTKFKSLNEKSAQNFHTKTIDDQNWWCEGEVEYFNLFLQLFRFRNYNHPTFSPGFFYTSNIEEIEEMDGYIVLTTKNSKYKVEKVEKPKF
jgi:hypothetical protein